MVVVDAESGRRVVGQRGIAVDGFVGGGAVGDDERMLLARLLEAPPNPLFLHQPADEVVVRLAVLYAIIAWLVLALQEELRINAGEHVFDDFRSALVLKNTRTIAMREQPDRRNQLDAVMFLGPVFAGQLDAADESMKPPLP